MTGKEAEFLIDNINAGNCEKGYTLILCFSRVGCVQPFFERFKKLKFNKKKCHLLVFDNTDDALLSKALLPYATSFVCDFISVRYYKTYRKGGCVLRGERNDDFYKSKIWDISEMQHDIISLITTDVFVQLEDDELPQNPYTIPRLLKLLKQPGVHLSTGVSSARNPELLPVGMGVHQIVERDGDRIIKRICCSPKTKGIVEVQGTGFYCFAAYSNFWLSALDDARNVASGLPHWAFDTWVTNQITKNGGKILADFSCWCDHVQLLHEGPYLFNQKCAVLDCYVYVPELDIYVYWQNNEKYGWVINDENFTRNSKRASSEILRR